MNEKQERNLQKFENLQNNLLTYEIELRGELEDVLNKSYGLRAASVKNIIEWQTQLHKVTLILEQAKDKLNLFNLSQSKELGE